VPPSAYARLVRGLGNGSRRTRLSGVPETSAAAL